jgi:hypothetical protein
MCILPRYTAAAPHFPAERVTPSPALACSMPLVHARRSTKYVLLCIVARVDPSTRSTRLCAMLQAQREQDIRHRVHPTLPGGSQGASQEQCGRGHAGRPSSHTAGVQAQAGCSPRAEDAKEEGASAQGCGACLLDVLLECAAHAVEAAGVCCGALVATTGRRGTPTALACCLVR